MEREKKVFYTNATGIEVTNLDLKLKINYQTRGEEIELCDIIFSPEQAKLTSIMLNKAIEEFEKKNRKLNVKIEGIEKSEGINNNGGEEK